jgi:hypothetical protein
LFAFFRHTFGFDKKQPASVMLSPSQCETARTMPPMQKPAQKVDIPAFCAVQARPKVV